MKRHTHRVHIDYLRLVSANTTEKNSSMTKKMKLKSQTAYCYETNEHLVQSRIPPYNSSIYSRQAGITNTFLFRCYH